jgi:hypothetical protein
MSEWTLSGLSINTAPPNFSRPGRHRSIGHATHVRLSGTTKIMPNTAGGITPASAAFQRHAA